MLVPWMSDAYTSLLSQGPYRHVLSGLSVDLEAVFHCLHSGQVSSFRSACGAAYVAGGREQTLMQDMESCQTRYRG